MQSKWLYIFFGVLLLTGIFAVIFFGLQPKPVPIINLSSFETPLKLAEAIQLSMQKEIQGAQILAFGFQPEHPEQLTIIQNFLMTNTNAADAYDTIIAEQNLGELANIKVDEKLDMKMKTDILLIALQTALQQKRRVLLIMPSMYASQMVLGSVADALKKGGIPLTSFSIVELLRHREEEKQTSIPCILTGDDATGAGALGCAVLKQSRALYRKKMAPAKKVGLINQRGATDYLIFYSNDPESVVSF